MKKYGSSNIWEIILHYEFQLYVAVICAFENEPGTTHWIFNTSLDIPCVASTDPSLVLWYRSADDDQPPKVIATSISGVNEDYRHHYDLKNTNSKDFTLRILSVTWSEPRFWCFIRVTLPNGTTVSVTSSKSNITTVGELLYWHIIPYFETLNILLKEYIAMYMYACRI